MKKFVLFFLVSSFLVPLAFAKDRGQCLNIAVRAAQAIGRLEASWPDELVLRSAEYLNVCKTIKTHDLYMISFDKIERRLGRSGFTAEKKAFGNYVVTTDFETCRIVGVELDQP